MYTVYSVYCGPDMKTGHSKRRLPEIEWPCRGSQAMSKCPALHAVVFAAGKSQIPDSSNRACLQAPMEKPGTSWTSLLATCHYILLPLDALTMHCQLATEMLKTSRAFCSFTANDARVYRRVRVQLWRYMPICCQCGLHVFVLYWCKRVYVKLRLEFK